MPSIVVLVSWLLIDIQDAFGDLASLVWLLVMMESIACDGSAGAEIFSSILLWLTDFLHQRIQRVTVDGTYF